MQRRRVWLAIAIAGLAACSATGTTTTNSPPSPATPETGAPPPATAGQEPGSPATTPATPQPSWTGDRGNAIANDEPCTRVTSNLAVLSPVALHHEDLEQMVPDQAEIAGLGELVRDVSRHGYQDNPEVASLEVNPGTTCEDFVRFGRIEGYATAYATPELTPPFVLLAVHEFWDEAGATAWTDSFLGAMTASVGKPDGPTAFRALPPVATAPGVALYEHVGPQGTRTWAWVRQGPVVGWVVNLPEGTTTSIDVAAAGAMLAARIERVSTAAASRPRVGLDTVQLLSAPLPLEAYGARANGLAWDSWFGGCQDAVERGLIAGEAAEQFARTFGRVTGCTAMYDPPPDSGAATTVVRVFSGVNVWSDAAGASKAMVAGLAELEARGGRRVTVTGLGDEAIGLVTPRGGDVGHDDTRVVFQIGAYTGSVAIQDRNPADATADVEALARRLAERMSLLLQAP